MKKANDIRPGKKEIGNEDMMEIKMLPLKKCRREIPCAVPSAGAPLRRTRHSAPRLRGGRSDRTVLTRPASHGA